MRRVRRAEAVPGRVLVTDLDGTLLDHHTYLPGPALAALRRVTEAGIPVVFCSAKTRAEQEHLREELGVGGPFIVENGAAVHGLPTGPIVLGEGYHTVRARLAGAARATGVSVVGYGDMDVAEIAERTGLDRDAAARAAAREHTETFVLEPPEALPRLAETAAVVGLRLLRGSRFLTATGGHDKGGAVRALASCWAPGTVLYGVGDEHNDLDMLTAVDVPLLVRRHDGDWADLPVEGLQRLDGIGPDGWMLAADAVLGR
jgi:mannosyl-3-phosphoglycerate phosphatase family protein